MWRLPMRKPVGGYVGKSVSAAPTDVPTYRPTDLLSRLRSAFKQVVGMPDYARYLEHACEKHPGCPVLSEREFYDRFIAGRYAGGGLRCC
jgi:uncharacterized short protein YbdD (DUF466 family)